MQQLRVVAHAGQGSPASVSDAAANAVDAAVSALEARAPALDAALAGVLVLEDDPRTNAGIGSVIRLDARTIECDASVADDEGHFGAVAGITGVRHPVLVARAVMDTPHRLLAGAGAQAFALTLGLQSADLRTQRAFDRAQRNRAQLLEGKLWPDFDWRGRWNFESPTPELDVGLVFASPDGGPTATSEGGVASGIAGGLTGVKWPGGSAASAGSDAPTGKADGKGGPPSGGQDGKASPSDTVGVVIRSPDGRYAAALSTGGNGIALRGRVGDVPQYGSGLYAGPWGAVATTGLGEAIVREHAALAVYEMLVEGTHPQVAAQRVVARFGKDEGIGIIAVSDLGYGAAASTQMAWAAADGTHRSQADTRVQHVPQ